MKDSRLYRIAALSVAVYFGITIVAEVSRFAVAARSCTAESTVYTFGEWVNCTSRITATIKEPMPD